MRTSQMYLIARFLTWPAAWAGLGVLLIIGFVVQAFGIGEPDNPADLVCIGAKEYDISDEDDRQEVIDNFIEWPETDPAKVLQTTALRYVWRSGFAGNNKQDFQG